MFQSKKMSIDEGCKLYPAGSEEIKDEMKAWGFDEEKELFCLHCEDIIKTKDIKVIFDMYERPYGKVAEYYLVCPNGECDGSPIDWSTKEENEHNKEIYELFT